MRALLDVNLLLALVDEQHVHHELSHRWWSANRPHGWASCPLTQNGFLRVISQPRYPNPLSYAAAHDLLARQVLDTAHKLWPDDVSLLDDKRFDRDQILGPKQITDVYLLALAVKNDGRLATLDTAIPLGAVRGATSRHLASVS